MREFVARALIQAWRAEAQMYRLSDDILEEIGCTWAPVSSRIFMAERNKPVSDLLWDGRFKSALILLIRSGLGKCRQFNMRTHIGARALSRNGAEVNLTLTGKRISPKHDWKYVK